VHRAKDDVTPSWRWLCRIAETVGDERADVLGRIYHEDALLALLARRRPDLAEVVKAGPGAGAELPAGMPVPRQPHRFSGRTAMYADVSVHEPKTAIDQESPLGFSMEGHRLDAPGALLPFVWAPGWNSNQSVYKFQAEVGGALRGGPAGVRLSVGQSVPLTAVEDADADSRAGSAAEGAFRVVPLQDVFGSDELSDHAPAIRARAPAPFVCMSVEDAEALGVESGVGVQVRRGEVTASLQARVEPALPPGVVAIPAGMTGALFVAPGERVDLIVDPDYRAPPADRRSGGIIARG
jgi:NADH-quinone oxidoreductase subunit G